MRFRVSQEIGHLKQAKGQQVRDPQREREVIDRLKAYNQGPIGDEAIADLYTRIITEARNLEGEAP